VAHEIGHTYGLAHGSDCPRGSLQTCVDLGRSDGIEGTRIAQGGASGWNKSRWGGNAEVGGTPGSVFSLMHPENLPDVVAFITNEDYARLQETFRSLAARPPTMPGRPRSPRRWRGGGALHVQEVRVPGLQVAGAIDVATGRAVLLSVVPVVRAAAPPAAAAAPDGARLEARAGDGALLARVAIDAEPPDPHHAPEAPAALRPFAAFLPAGADVASLAVLDGDRLLIEWRVSAEAPDLELPDGPLDATSDVRLTWTASDPDGDPLRFDVDYAPDGRDWRPLAIGLRAASLRLSPDALPPGPEPRIRVVARDGLRATAAEIAVVLGGAPRLAATAPAEGDTTPPTTAVTVWTVGELGEVGPDALTLLREDAPAGEPARIPGRLTRLPAGDGLRFVPDAPLAADASYRATFGAGVVAGDGTAFDGALSWSFRTGPAAPERAFQERNLTGRPLGSAAGDDAEAAATSRDRVAGDVRGPRAGRLRAAAAGRREPGRDARGGRRLPPRGHVRGRAGRRPRLRRARRAHEPALPHRQPRRGRRGAHRRARRGVAVRDHALADLVRLGSDAQVLGRRLADPVALVVVLVRVGEHLFDLPAIVDGAALDHPAALVVGPRVRLDDGPLRALHLDQDGTELAFDHAPGRRDLAVLVVLHVRVFEVGHAVRTLFRQALLGVVQPLFDQPSVRVVHALHRAVEFAVAELHRAHHVAGFVVRVHGPARLDAFDVDRDLLGQPALLVVVVVGLPDRLVLGVVDDRPHRFAALEGGDLPRLQRTLAVVLEDQPFGRESRLVEREGADPLARGAARELAELLHRGDRADEVERVGGGRRRGGRADHDQERQHAARREAPRRHRREQRRRHRDHAHRGAGRDRALVELLQDVRRARLHGRGPEQDRADELAEGDREDQDRAGQRVRPQERDDDAPEGDEGAGAVDARRALERGGEMPACPACTYCTTNGRYCAR
jgi:hypothetical protein